MYILKKQSGWGVRHRSTQARLIATILRILTWCFPSFHKITTYRLPRLVAGDDGCRGSRVPAKRPRYVIGLVKLNETFMKHVVLYSTLGNWDFLPAAWISQNNISHADQLGQEEEHTGMQIRLSDRSASTTDSTVIEGIGCVCMPLPPGPNEAVVEEVSLCISSLILFTYYWFQLLLLLLLLLRYNVQPDFFFTFCQTQQVKGGCN